MVEPMLVTNLQPKAELYREFARIMGYALSKEVDSPKENPGATNLILSEYHHWIYFGRLKGWNVAGNDSHSYEKR
jgi:hypothetical protein